MLTDLNVSVKLFACVKVCIRERAEGERWEVGISIISKSIPAAHDNPLQSTVELFRSTFQSSNPIGQYIIIHNYNYAHMCRFPNNTLN